MKELENSATEGESPVVKMFGQSLLMFPTGFDPWISEWDNPLGLIAQYRPDEFIVRRSDTQPGRHASDGRVAEKLEQGDRLETEEKVAHRSTR
jgi:hypothetical protein